MADDCTGTYFSAETGTTFTWSCVYMYDKQERDVVYVATIYKPGDPAFQVQSFVMFDPAVQDDPVKVIEAEIKRRITLCCSEAGIRRRWSP